jgi:hypothetical protein
MLRAAIRAFLPAIRRFPANSEAGENMRPPSRDGLDELRAFLLDFVNHGELDRFAFLLQLVSQARITFCFQFRPKLIPPFQHKPARRRGSPRFRSAALIEHKPPEATARTTTTTSFLSLVTDHASLGYVFSEP